MSGCVCMLAFTVSVGTDLFVDTLFLFIRLYRFTLGRSSYFGGRVFVHYVASYSYSIFHRRFFFICCFHCPCLFVCIVCRTTKSLLPHSLSYCVHLLLFNVRVCTPWTYKKLYMLYSCNHTCLVFLYFDLFLSSLVSMPVGGCWSLFGTGGFFCITFASLNVDF
jgi:hypothetical protein